MIKHDFALTPFPAAELPRITIAGNIRLYNNRVNLHYCLTGKVEDVFLPSTSAQSDRKDELWKSTCFEFFLAIRDQPEYWEFNMSPSGDWNIYHMDEYRRIGFREELSIPQLSFNIREGTGKFTLDAVVDLNPIVEPDQDFQVAIAAIIQTQNGNETYWALTHPGVHADFHLRESFVIQLRNIVKAET